MKLTNLIRKNDSVGVATATHATFATQSTESTGTVARVATVAVASPAEVQSATLNPADETRIRAWLTHIGETHIPTIDEVLTMCANDPAALEYYLLRSAEVPRSNQDEAIK